MFPGDIPTVDSVSFVRPERTFAMRVSHHLARLEPLVLAPLHGLSDGDWYRAPKGKWSIAQIVQHVAIGIDLVGRSFAALAGTPPMRRQNKPHETVLRHLTLGIGHYPAALKALPQANPDPKPDHDLVTAQFRMGVEQYKEIAGTWTTTQQQDHYVPHPLLGDLNFPEWVRFHFLHCRHHATEIRQRMKWMGK